MHFEHTKKGSSRAERTTLILREQCKNIAKNLEWQNDDRNSKNGFFLKKNGTLFGFLEVISHFKEIKVLKRVVC